LTDKIQQHLPADIQIISQGDIVAKSLADYLERHISLADQCSKNGNREFYTTGDIDDFNSHASLFFGENIIAGHVDLS
jgi:glutamate racemase